MCECVCVCVYFTFRYKIYIIENIIILGKGREEGKWKYGDKDSVF